MKDSFYKQLIEDSPTGYAYNKIICDEDGIPCDYEFIDVNKTFKKIIGLKGIDIVGRKISNVILHLGKNKNDWLKFYGDIAIDGGEKEVELFLEGSKRGYKVMVRFTEKYYFTTHFIDITKQMSQLSEMKKLIEISEKLVVTRKRVEDELLNEKILTDAIFNSVPGMIYLYDQKGRLVRWNKKHEDITGYAPEELAKMSIMDWYNGDEESIKAIEDGIGRATTEGFGDAEANLQKKDGIKVAMYFTASALRLDGKLYFAGLAVDIADRKKKEEEIYYLSYHGQLTGLYNRRFYEEEIKRLDVERNLPLTIVMGDVNGLKLINDSFGHVMGDKLLKKVAEIISLGCREDDIIARLGGDEFVIILPKTDHFEAEQIIKRITDLSGGEKVGFVDISISFGYQTKNTEKEELEEIFKNAEDNMYKKKLFESPSMRGKTITAIINTLHEKNKMEERHSNRVSELCRKMGEILGMPKNENKELRSVALLHDIGKIAIDESILNKIGKLTDDEWKEIKTHPEIGYRMINTVANMSGTASYILHHHERWDGKGYPKGLKEEEIPFMSRIIAISDSYDAMTSERIYKGAMSKDAAIEELQNNAGTQFDPELVNIFIDKVLL